MLGRIRVVRLSLEIHKPQDRIITDRLEGRDLSALLFRGFSGDSIGTMQKFGTDVPQRSYIYASPIEELRTEYPNNQQNPFRYAFGTGPERLPSMIGRN
jgi:hypothetical protein